MWWIILISILIPAIIIVIFVAIKIVSKIEHDRGDYNDGGGIHAGIDEHIPFFTPANDRAGIIGEKKTTYHLKPLLRNDEYLLTNLLLPLQNGKKREIDCVLITRKGIFCIEIKNWVGHISGNDEDEYWLQGYDDPYWDDRRHKNPVKQNSQNCILLRRELNNQYWINNVVIFYNLEDRCGINSKYTYTVKQFKDHYRSLDSDAIPESYLSIIFEKLKKYIGTLEELQKHRKRN